MRQQAFPLPSGHADDEKEMEQFRRKAHDYIALDGGNTPTNLAPTRINLTMAE